MVKDIKTERVDPPVTFGPHPITFFEHQGVAYFTGHDKSWGQYTHSQENRRTMRFS